MNVAGVMLLRFIGSLQHSAEAQAAYAVGYAELFSLITWTSVGLMGAAAAVAGQNLGAGQPDRATHGVHVAARIGIGVAAIVGALFLLIPEQLLAIFGLKDPIVVQLGRELLRFLSVSGLFITVALTYTGASKEPVTRAARSTSRSCRRSCCHSACALPCSTGEPCRRPVSGPPS